MLQKGGSMHTRPVSLLLLAVVGHTSCVPIDVVLLPPYPDSTDAATNSTKPIPDLMGLRIEATDGTHIVEDGQAPAESARFKAIGDFSNGERDVSSEVKWRVNDEQLGSIDEHGVFVTLGRGGKTYIEARSSPFVTTTDLSVVSERVLIDDDVSRDAPSAFPQDTSGDEMLSGNVPALAYPSNLAMLPKNLPELHMQWISPIAATTYEVRIDGEYARLRYYTRKQTWLIENSILQPVLQGHASLSLRFRVRSIADVNPMVTMGSKDFTIYVSDSDMSGALYFESQEAQSIMRASLRDTESAQFQPDLDNRDVSNHAISRGGQRMAFSYDGKLRVIALDSENEILVNGQVFDDGGEIEDQTMTWGTLNPSGTHVLLAEQGEFVLVDVASKTVILERDFDNGEFSTQPDWSPDGQYVVFARITGSQQPQSPSDFTGTEIYRMPVETGRGQLGTAELIAARTSPSSTLYAPTYSPDGRWIAYVAAEGSIKDNQDLEIFIIRSDGSGDATRLGHLNRSVADQTDVTGIGNTYPTWVSAGTPDKYWMVFSSVRDYGTALTDLEPSEFQMWCSAIDLSESAPKTHAAFWLPFQQTQGRNIRALWRDE
jgi:hypothetical protein